jgi:exonuclease III
MIVVSWNYRGLGSKVKVKALRDLIRAENPSIVLIQETKLVDWEILSITKQQ